MSALISAADITQVQQIVFVGTEEPPCVKTVQFQIKSVKRISLPERYNFIYLNFL